MINVSALLYWCLRFGHLHLVRAECVCVASGPRLCAADPAGQRLL